MKRTAPRKSLSRAFDRLRPGIAIDIGTCWTRMTAPGTGRIQEPTLQAVSRSTGEVVAWGRASVSQLIRDGAAVRLERPVMEGVVADFLGFRFILKGLLERARCKRGLLRPRILVSVAAVLTKVEHAALRDACRQAGAVDVLLVQSARAAAVGSGLAIGDVTGRMVVEAGAGCCAATVFSRGHVVVARSARFGSQAIDTALEEYLRHEYQIWVGAESIRIAKERHATVREEGEDGWFDLRGMDMTTNLPRTVSVPRSDLREIAWPSVRRLRDLVESTLAETPPELAGDLIENGIMLTGGLARLEGLADELQRFTGCPVVTAVEPELAPLRGLSRLMSEPEGSQLTHQMIE